MKNQMMKISPELATAMLKDNQNNRTLSKAHVKSLADQMNRGVWQTNGESIKMAEDGSLLDGQHRLHAIIFSGKTIEMLIISELPLESFVTIDTGKKRSGGDVLSIDKVKNAFIVAGAIRLVLIHRRHMEGLGVDKRQVSNEQVLQFERQENMSEISSQAMAWYKKNMLISPCLILFFYFTFNQIDKEDSEEFMDKFCTGNNLDETHPVKLLRDRIMKHKSSRLVLPSEHLQAMVFRAWNYFRKRKTVKQFPIFNYDGTPIILL